ncbi:GerMN domain-containing protein [uncultured Dysosmobacter sp.]|uniref:GerMN domain-containing protein n=1 Tax=uncultured Dysosmobacter sp. TaxID=2591384 RepID=UPI0026326A40|nr:GerMN domain-containing protein [uncultured Dysosmobacter sp.]
MKRMRLILLCALVLLTCGCADVSGEQAEGYDLYFMRADLEEASGDGALQAEKVYLNGLEEADTRQMVETLVTELLNGPMEASLKSTIPSGTTLLSAEVKGSQAVVDLSYAYSTLSGVGLTLADQAITLTLTQLPDILSVKITVRGRELVYRDKQVFTTRDVLLFPEEDVVATVQATLYFLGEDGTLTAEDQTLDLYEGDTQVGVVARALENGPQGKDLSPVMPEGFRVKSVWLEEDVCYVNLSSVVLEELENTTALPWALEALGRSLCSLDTVGEVRFLVDGEFAESYGPVGIGIPYTA